MLVSVKIYCKKEVPLQKSPKYKNHFMKIKSQSVFCTYAFGHTFFSFYGGVYCPYGSKTKVKLLKISSKLQYYQKHPVLQASLIQNPTKTMKQYTFLKEEKNLKGLLYQTYKFGEDCMTQLKFTKN